MTKEIAKKETQTHMTVGDRGGVASQLDPRDVLIHRILLAQNMSQVVNDGGVAIGDLYDSVTKEVLAKKGAPLEIVPLYSYKSWVVSQEIKGRFEFRRIEKWTAQNSDAPWEYTEGGSNWKRTQSLNFFVMTTASLKKEKELIVLLNSGKPLPAVLEMAKPFMVSFQSSSYKAGKSLVDHFNTIQLFQARGVKVDVFRNIFKLSSATEKNDKGTFSIFTVENTKAMVTPEDQNICAQWQMEISANAAKMRVDEDPVAVVEETPRASSQDAVDFAQGEAY